MATSDSVNELAAALAKAQGVMRAAPMDRDNPFFKSKYATLNSIWEAIRAPLSENGLSVVQTPDQADGDVVLTTTLFHASGQWISSTLRMRPAKQDPQGIGSALSYARRYALAAMVGVTSDEDDDGNASSEKDGKANGKQRGTSTSQTTQPLAQTTQATTTTQPTTQQPPVTSQPNGNGNGNGAPPKCLILGDAVRVWSKLATQFAEDVPEYKQPNNGMPDFEHIQRSFGKDGYTKIATIADLEAAFAQLRQRKATA